MTGRVFMDFETQSYCDLTQTGAWVYSLHPTTKPICLCHRVRHDSKPSELIQDWVPGEPMPEDLKAAILAGYEVEAHNYSFELGIWNNIMVPRYGWVPIQPEQWRCSMAVASYYAMPAALDALCRALGWKGKDPEGSRLITKYSKLHLKTAKEEIPPDDLRKFIDYCSRDVELEEAVSDYLGDLPPHELAIFQLDQRINLRGLYIDQAGVAAATTIVDQRSEELTSRFREITGLNPTQGGKLLGWFAERGLVLENMQAAYLKELLEGDSDEAGSP